MPSQSHALQTLLAVAPALALLAAVVGLVAYLYELGLFQRMLYLFPSFEHIGLIGFILVPIFVVFMLIWAAVCLAISGVLLLFFLGVAVALVIATGELLVNLFAESWATRDPLGLLRERLLSIWRGTLRVVRRGP
jgi:hypothetical protein